MAIQQISVFVENQKGKLLGTVKTLAEAGIKLCAGVQGQADEAAKALAEGTLVYDPNARCDHHGSHHEGDCGHHHGGEGGHVYGDEECGRRRREGECERDKDECGHHHHDDQCGHDRCADHHCHGN